MLNLKAAQEEYRQTCQSLKIYDLNAWVGTVEEPHIGAIENIHDLLTLMDRAGIENAVVTSIAAHSSHHINGHVELTKMLSESERLCGAYILLPTHTGEQGDSASTVIKRALDDGFCVFRMFPTAHSFTMDDWCVGDLLAELQERRLPLILWHSETTWNTIRGLCLRYPDLPLIVEGSGRKILYDNRVFYPLLAECRNLYLETHALINMGIFEHMHRRKLSDRLLFGSGIPWQDVQCSLGPVAMANLPLGVRHDIAGGTLRTLLRGERP